MSILLTSDGISSKPIISEFKKLFQDPSKNKLLVIHTATDSDEEEMVEYFTNSIIKQGFSKSNIDLRNISKNIIPDKKDYDSIYLLGGSTFYILDRLRKTKFDVLIKDLVSKGKHLIAVSAGSIIAGADIGITQFGSEGEENEIGLKNLEGLKLVDFTIYPHFRKELTNELTEATKDYPYEVEYLEDGEAIIVAKEIKRRI